MKPETTGADLIAAVERTLAREVAPELAGAARFKVLMAASALRMALRELATDDALRAAAAPLGGADQGPLAAALRAGSHDADAVTYAALLVDARARTAVSRPEAAGEAVEPPSGAR
jgi:hypothetical protein